jgi:hypothetical protein
MASPMKMRPIALSGRGSLGDHRRYPGCRLLITCALCGWEKSYNPERVIARLRELNTGGHGTPLEQVARRIGWNCPACHHVRWRADLAWAPGMDIREIKRLTNLHR